MPRNDIALRQWRSLIDRKLNSIDVIGTLTDLLVLRCGPIHVHPDHGPEFIA